MNEKSENLNTIPAPDTQPAPDYPQQPAPPYQPAPDMPYPPARPVGGSVPAPQEPYDLPYPPLQPIQAEQPAPDPEPKRKKSKKPLLITLIAVAAACVLAAIFLIVFLPGILNGDTYDRAKALMESGDYAEAGELFESVGSYRNAPTLMQECYFTEATQLIKSENSDDVNHAVELLEKIPDYDGSKEKLKEAKYQYIRLNYNSDDELTYRYVCDLKESGYRDVDSIYIRLYQWVAEVYWNTSQDQKDVDLDSISKYSPVYCHIHLIGGTPGDSVTLYFEYTLPSGNSGKDTQEGMVRGGWTDFRWSDGLYSEPKYGTTGVLRARIYDEDHNLLYSGSVRITD